MGKQLKILLVNDFIKKIGGAEIFVHKLKDSLEKKGHTVKIFGSSDKENFKSFFSRWYSIKWRNLIKKEILSFKPDVIHINNFSRIISPSIVMVSLKSKAKVVMTFHDVYLLKGETKNKNLLIRILKNLRIGLHKKAIKNKNISFVSPSDFLAKPLEKILKQKIGIIPNGVDIPKKQTKYEKIILYVGDISKGKGFPLIAPILNELKGYKTIVLGKGELKEILEQKYKNIKFLGFQKPDKYYEKASILVYPSMLKENFPLSTLEGMSYGVVTIASNIGGIKEQIKDNKTGFLFNPKKKGEFEKIIIYLAKNQNKIKLIGKNARESVKQNFNWEKIIKQYEKIYKNEK